MSYIYNNNLYNKFYKFYDLPNGKRVEEYQIPYLEDVEDAIYLMQRDFSYYKDLKKELRDNPDILKEALIGFVKFYREYSGYISASKMVNPISYAGENALTEENIELSLVAKGSAIQSFCEGLRNPKFVIRMYEIGAKVTFHYLPSEIKNNPMVLKKALEKFDPNDPDLDEANPITYAQEGALIEENIRLALEKGKIRLLPHSPLAKNELFHRINIEQGKIFIEYEDLPDSIKEDDNLMLNYVSKWPDQFEQLNERQRNNPEILNKAITNFDRTFKEVNPISYAKEGALTEENIRLALSKGLITLFHDGPLCKSELFHKLNIEQGMPTLVFYADLPDSIKEDDSLMLKFIHEVPGVYYDLNERQKNNPEILYAALNNYNPNGVLLNPISFANEGALTEDNINLAIKKGKIEIQKDSALANNRYFILECLKRKIYTEFYVNISDSLRSDPEIGKLLDVVMPSSIIQSKAIDMDNGWSPLGYRKIYKYYQGIIGITDNGDCIEEEVGLLEHHYNRIISVVNSFASKYPNDKKYQELQIETRKTDNNPFLAGLKCSEHGILIILIEGESSQIYFPGTISQEQFNTLLGLLNDLKGLNFRFLYDDEEFYECILPETHKARKLNSDDVINFIKEHNIVVPSEEIEIEDVSDTPKAI